MAIEFTLPALGENVKGGDVLHVLVKAGDTVEKEQPVLELETDKATVEVPSSVSGTIQDVKVADGDAITVGQVLFTLADGDGAQAGAEEAHSGGQEAQSGGQEAKSGSQEAKSGSQNGGKADGVEAKAPAGATEKASFEAVNDQDEGLDDEAEQPTSSEGGGGRLEVTLPSLGEGVKGADVLHVLVKAGDTIEKEQGILELETDKATVEMPSPSAGTVVEVKVAEGDQITTGDVVIVLDPAGGGDATASSKANAQKTDGAGRTPASTDEAAPKPAGQPAPQAATQSAQARPAASASAGAGTGAVAPPRPNVPAAPSVRRLARELGLDVADVKGAGPGGRISQSDVMAHAKHVITQAPAAGAGGGGGFAFEPLPDFSQYGEVERKAMRGIRRKTAEHMVASWHTIPHVTQCEKADITDLEALRKQFGKRVEQGGGKLTVTSIAVKVAALALRKFPQFNASVDLPNETVVYKQYVNIGLAVDTERGLLVPVIRNADTKSITEISAEIGQLAEKARKGKLSIEEMSGGCFTITNLGGIGGTYFTPIVNHPEVAILGMSRSAMEPVWKDDAFEPRLMLPLSLSYDHRVIDGADAMRFLRYVADALEQPFVMSL